MKIKTVDNFFGECKNFDQKKIFEETKGEYDCLSLKGKKFRADLYLRDLHQAQVLNFFSEKIDKDEFVISLDFNDEKKIVRTGNYIGRIFYDGIEIEIGSRFGESFLLRMLEVAEDVYFDSGKIVGGSGTNKNLDFARKILCINFMQNLEKAFLLGIPKEYATLYSHKSTIYGEPDIKKIIKKDTPFKGLISSKRNVQKEIDEIVNVLYQAVRIIQRFGVNTSNISHIIPYLKSRVSKYKRVSIQKILNSKALRNPIYAPYIKTLRLADLIIKNNSYLGKEEEFGFLINVASLFEKYIYKLLQKNFPDWVIVHEQKISIYEKSLLHRIMIPDIVLENDKKLVVIDCKYKKIDFQHPDMERCDFFQIHTYMAYYLSRFENVKGGLVYPATEISSQNFVQSNSFLNSNASFFITGIKTSSITTQKLLNDNEIEFLEQLSEILK